MKHHRIPKMATPHDASAAINSSNTNPNKARHEFTGNRPDVKYYTPGEEAVSRAGQPQNPHMPAVPFGSLGRDDMNAEAMRSGQPQHPMMPSYPPAIHAPAEYDESEGER